ncbi:MAG: SMP-30/gluconolactonase/LRE family protein [Granulosicoccus sp.]
MQIDPLATRRVDSVSFVGESLKRPECVLCTRAGHWYSADWRGGVAHCDPGGKLSLYSATLGERPLRPNGLALLPDGSFLLADLGEQMGGVFKLWRDGAVRPFLEQVDGIDLPPTNFVMLDRLNRIWITVSTRLQPRSLGYNAHCADGFIVLVDNTGARIVADGLGYTNECIVSQDGRHLWVNETFGRRLSRFDIAADGSLSNQQTLAHFAHGLYPDGLAQDINGDFWVTSIVSNRVAHVDRDGIVTVWLDDSDSSHVSEAELAYQSGKLGRQHLDSIKSRRLKNISSLAFGGPRLTTGHLGCLLGDQIALVEMPVAGVAPAHWHFDD